MARENPAKNTAEEPRIVVDIQYNTVCQPSGPDIAQPVILILANAAGYRLLAKRFESMAHRGRGQPDAWSDPEDHLHVSMHDDGFDPELSSNLEFRLGVLNDENADAVIERYDLAGRPHRHACMTRWFQSMVDGASREIALWEPADDTE